MTVQHADTHASLTDCGSSRHVRPAMPGAEQLEWQQPYGHVRVLDHTCWQCAHVSYEWCQLGGAYVIRRTDRHRLHDAEVHQTAPMHHALAWEWWQALLHGCAI